MPGIIKVGYDAPDLEGESEKPYFHLQDLEQRSELFLKEVRQQAAALLNQAQAQTEALRQQTIQQARQEALAIARLELQQETQRRVAMLEPMLQTSVSQLQQQLLAWRLAWEQRAIDLAVGIAEKICRRELMSRPEIVLSQIEAALQLAGPDDQIELRIHPQDREVFGPLIDALVARLTDLSRTLLIEDPQIQTGGCVVRTKYGSIDTQLSTQLARIAEELAP